MKTYNNKIKTITSTLWGLALIIGLGACSSGGDGGGGSPRTAGGERGAEFTSWLMSVGLESVEGKEGYQHPKNAEGQPYWEALNGRGATAGKWKQVLQDSASGQYYVLNRTTSGHAARTNAWDNNDRSLLPLTEVTKMDNPMYDGTPTPPHSYPIDQYLHCTAAGFCYNLPANVVGGSFPKDLAGMAAMERSLTVAVYSDKLRSLGLTQEDSESMALTIATFHKKVVDTSLTGADTRAFFASVGVRSEEDMNDIESAIKESMATNNFALTAAAIADKVMKTKSFTTSRENLEAAILQYIEEKN